MIPINVRFNGGEPAQWPPGATVQLLGVDVSQFEAQGQWNHAVLVVGITR